MILITALLIFFHTRKARQQTEKKDVEILKEVELN